MKIGFIGLGIMGSRMAQHLLENGHGLVVYNRTMDKARDLLAKGAQWAATPADAAQGAEVLFTMLAHPEAIEASAYGDMGFLNALPAQAIWVDCSTVNPSFSRKMAHEAHQRQIIFIDAPVTGSKNQALNAELLFLVGGEADHITTIEPLLTCMGKRIVHVGDVGMGTSLKMVVNTLLATSMVAFSEAVVLGRSLGISEQTLFSTLIGGPVVPPFMAGKQAKLLAKDGDAEFPMQWIYKDLQLAGVTAYESGTGSLLTSVTKEIFAMAIRDGYGEQDFSAIYHYLNQPD